MVFFTVLNLNPQGSMLFFIYAVHNPRTKLCRAVKSAYPAPPSLLQCLLCQQAWRAWITVCPRKSLPAELESRCTGNHSAWLLRTLFHIVSTFRALTCCSEWRSFAPSPWFLPAGLSNSSSTTLSIKPGCHGVFQHTGYSTHKPKGEESSGGS